MALLLLLLAPALGLPVLGGQAAGWLHYLGGPSRSGYVDTSMYRGVVRGYSMRVLFEAGLCIGSNPLVIPLGGRALVVFEACDGYMYAVDPGGGLAWRVRTGGGLTNPEAGDVDGDGRVEVVSTGASGYLFVVDAETGRVEWSVGDGTVKGSPLVVDVNGDGAPDIVVGDLRGSLHVYTGDGRERWSLGLPTGAPVDFASAARMGGTLYLAASTPRGVVVLRHTSGYGFEPLYTVEPLGGEGDRVRGAAPIADIDGDGRLELVVASEQGLEAVDLATGKLEWSARMEWDIMFGPTVGDATNDGRPDIVEASLEGLYIFDGATGSVEAEYPTLRSLAPVVIADVDLDGRNDLVVGGYDNEIDIATYLGPGDYDVVGFWETRGPFVAPAAIADLNGDGLPDIVMGCRDFRVYALTAQGTPAPGPGGGTAGTSTATTGEKATGGQASTTSTGETTSQPATGGTTSGRAPPPPAGAPGHGWPLWAVGLGAALFAGGALLLALSRRGR